MPLVRIQSNAARATLDAVAQTVHAAMVEHLGVPHDDVFRVIDATSAVVADAGYLGIVRERPIFIEITLRRGRTDDAKRAFYRAVANACAQSSSARPEDLLVVLRENEPIDWSFGNGIAQYARAEDERISSTAASVSTDTVTPTRSSRHLVCRLADAEQRDA